MAMIPCPECGNTISDRVSKCPHCGYPMDSKKSRYSQFYEKPRPQTFQIEPQYEEREERRSKQISSKSTALSVSAMIISFMGLFTSFIAIIIASGKPKEVYVEKEVPAYLEADQPQEEPYTEEPEIKEEVIPEEIEGEEPEVQVLEEEEPEEEAIKEEPKEAPQEQYEEIEENNEPEIQISRDDFIASCEEIPYKTIARNPEQYKGSHLKLTAKVAQVIQGGFFDSNEYYRVTSNDEYDMWFGDEYFMYDKREVKDPKILQDDILTIYAKCDGTTTVKRAFSGTKEDVVSINAVYIDFVIEN